ncbi:MAG TPA: hypothetical protein VNO70_15320 [Blastocatellia bacterium]|nr:hypothetical protein [Blastocatellia bacterium]
MTFEERLEALAVTVENMAAVVRDALDRQTRLEEVVEEHTRQIQEHGRQIGQLTNSLIGVTALAGTIVENQKRTDEAVAKLIENQKNTDETVKALSSRVDAFIVVLEKYISERSNNGHSS